MASIFFFNVPAHGHVNPTLPVVAELVRQGHTVTYFNAESFESVLAETGVDFYAYPNSSKMGDEFSARIHNLPSVTVFLLEQCKALLPFAISQLEKAKPDVVVFDALALWGMQSARLCGTPSVASIGLLIQEGVSGLLRLSDYLTMLRQGLPQVPSILRLRRELVKRYGESIFPTKGLLPAVGDATIVYTSREFQPETSFIDDTFHFVGPSIQPSMRTQTEFPWSQLDKDRPQIYLSLGTLYNDNIEFYRAVLSTFADHPAQLILSVGHQINMSDLGLIPSNAIVQPTVPQLALLPKVDLFITHGGMNSVSEALYYGVPMLILPQQLEQAINGRRVSEVGAGLALADKPPYGRIDAHTLRQPVDTLLANQSYRENAKQIGNTLKKAGGYKQAAKVIVAQSQK